MQDAPQEGQRLTALTIDRGAWLSLAVLAGAIGVVPISVMNVAFDAPVDEFENTPTATHGWAHSPATRRWPLQC